jgi:hypothetical protein
MSVLDQAFGGMSDEALDRLVAAEREEAAEARREERERALAAQVRREDLAAQARLGLRQVRSHADIIGAFAGGDGVDANAQRCRAVFERWLAAGGEVDELKALLGDTATQLRADFGHRQEQLRARVLEAESRKTADQRRIDALERQNFALKERVAYLEALAGGR